MDWPRDDDDPAQIRGGWTCPRDWRLLLCNDANDFSHRGVNEYILIPHQRLGDADRRDDVSEASMRTHRLSVFGTFTAGFSVLLVIGCTSSLSRSLMLTPDPSLDVNRPLVGRRAILSREDLATVREPISTLEAVRRLRPEFLHPSERAVGRTTSDMSLYVNDIYEGEVWQLNALPLYLIREITFLHPTEATAQFGTRCRCSGGALSVRTLLREP